MKPRTDLHPSTCPRDPNHRRQLMVDAIAELDMPAVHHLISEHAATTDDVQIAITQTERDQLEIMAAYTIWLDEKAAEAAATTRAVNKVRLLVASQPLPFPI